MHIKIIETVATYCIIVKKKQTKKFFGSFLVLISFFLFYFILDSSVCLWNQCTFFISLARPPMALVILEWMYWNLERRIKTKNEKKIGLNWKIPQSQPNILYDRLKQKQQQQQKKLKSISIEKHCFTSIIVAPVTKKTTTTNRIQNIIIVYNGKKNYDIEIKWI